MQINLIFASKEEKEIYELFSEDEMSELISRFLRRCIKNKIVTECVIHKSILAFASNSGQDEINQGEKVWRSKLLTFMENYHEKHY